MTPATLFTATTRTAPADVDDVSPAIVATALGRGALPTAPMAMPVQPLDGQLDASRARRRPVAAADRTLRRMSRAAAPVARVALLRTLAIGGSLLLACAALGLFLQSVGTDGLQALDIFRAVLIAVSTFLARMGRSARHSWPLCLDRAAPPPRHAHPRAHRHSCPRLQRRPRRHLCPHRRHGCRLAGPGLGRSTAFAILSDTRDDTIARREAFWFLRLLDDTGGEGRIFYRRRTHNRGRKAGNIADFIRTSGAAWDYALILDADSLMTGATIAEMIRRIEAEPTLGLLQSPPRSSAPGHALAGNAVRGRIPRPDLHARSCPVAGPTGPFWGHNAIVRIRAFAESCGLPELSGRPPFGGHLSAMIMSRPRFSPAPGGQCASIPISWALRGRPRKHGAARPP